MQKKSIGVFIGTALLAVTAYTFAAGQSVTIHAISERGMGKSLGTVKVKDGPEGLVLTTDLAGLPPGEHGFHVHEHGKCEHQMKDGKDVAGLAAGGHYDPHKTGKHEGPTGQGHLGDLPPLVADTDGNVKVRVVAPRLKAGDLKGRALMIHAGGDNFSDDPKPLGGGGARIACGVVP